MSYKVHTNCRACGYGPAFMAPNIKSGAPVDHLESVLDLGVMPLANAFRQNSQKRPGHYPVELLVCPRCFLGQLSAVVDPEVLYADYPYITSRTEMMLEHFRKLWTEMNELRPIENVVEIGSNDGYCLKVLTELGAQRVLGIDPAKNLCDEAAKDGVQSICALLDRESAEMARAAMPPIDLILARHVFCHVDDWQGFINNLGVMMTKDTIACIEVPYAGDMIRDCSWDTIYAEHLSYLTIKSMMHLLDNSMLRLHKVLSFPIHGGAICLVLMRRDNELPRHPSVNAFLEDEKCSLGAWRRFADQAKDSIAVMRSLVHDIREQGKTIAGLGASAKSTVWINACKFTRNDLLFIADTTRWKMYSSTPGTSIPILDSGAVLRELPDYTIVFAWNYKDEVIRNNQMYLNKGGTLIFPVPKIHQVNKNGESSPLTVKA